MGELATILNVSRRQWRWIAGGILLGIAVFAANALLMAVSGWFIASMALAGVAKASFNYFIPSAAIRALAIARTVGRYGERLVSHSAALRVLSDLRLWLFLRLEPLSPAIFDRYSSGELSGRLRSDVDAMENLYLRIIAPLCTGAFSILLSTAFVAIWCRSAAAALLVALILAGIFLPLMARRIADEPGRRSAELTVELRSMFADGLQGGAELVLLGAEERHAEHVARASAELVSTQEELARGAAFTLAGGLFSAGTGVLAVLVCTAVAFSAQQIDGPQLVMLLLFSAAAFEGAAGLPAALHLLPAVKESARRLAEISSTLLPVLEPATPSPLPEEFGLVLRGVSFSHDPSRPLLRDFNLELPPGGGVALVGPSGAGKSTVADLLLRFREYGGSITLGGHELRYYAGDDLRRLIAAVRQDSHLFNATIRENIVLSRPDADEDEIREVLYVAALDEWVASLPQGVETSVGEGGSAVSGGEARRISLARALLKNAPILILDEPTEGLDCATEQLVVKRLQQHLKGKSLLLITHRPACLELVDSVISMG